MGVRAVVVGVVAVGILAGGAVVADGVARERTQDEVAQRLRTEIGGLPAAPDVTIAGWPFLTQVLAGELDDVHVSAPGALVAGIPLERIEVDLQGVSTDRTRPTTARAVDMTAFVTLDTLRGQLPGDAGLAVADGRLVSSTTVLGLTLEVGFVPRAAGRTIAVDVQTLRLGGADVTAADLPAGLGDRLDGLDVPLEGLPTGVELTDLVLVDDGAELAAAGTDVVLEPPAG